MKKTIFWGAIAVLILVVGSFFGVFAVRAIAIAATLLATILLIISKKVKKSILKVTGVIALAAATWLIWPLTQLAVNFWATLGLSALAITLPFGLLWILTRKFKIWVKILATVLMVVLCLSFGPLQGWNWLKTTLFALQSQTEEQPTQPTDDTPADWTDKTGEPISLKSAIMSFTSTQPGRYLERPNGALDTVGELFEAARLEGNKAWFTKLESLLRIDQAEFEASAEMEKAEGFTPKAIFINGELDISDAKARETVAERWGYSEAEVATMPIVRTKGVVNTYLAKDGNIYTFIDQSQWVEILVGLFDCDTQKLKLGIKVDCANIVTPLTEHDYNTGLPHVDKESPKKPDAPKPTKPEPTPTESTTPPTKPEPTPTKLEPKPSDPKEYIKPSGLPTKPSVETDPVNTKTSEPTNETVAPTTVKSPTVETDPPKTTTSVGNSAQESEPVNNEPISNPFG